MKKRLLIILMSILMLVPIVCVLSACDSDGDYNYEITVWVGEGTKDLTEKQIEEFNQTNEWNVKFKATVEIVSESKAVGDATSKPADSADIFCFAQDTLARAVRSNLLASLNSASVEFIKQNNSEEAQQSATVGSSIRAFPMTADNGFFLYYNKDVIDESHVGNLEDIIADCRAAGQKFSAGLTDGGWYAAAFFYATGCSSTWDTDENGAFVNYHDDFNSDMGVAALKGLDKILSMGDYYEESDKVSTFSAATPSAAVISGIWDYKAAKDILGDKLGVAPLPSFTVDGETYQLPTFLGYKLMGVKPQSDPYKATYLQKLAMYLTGEECQRQRFEEMGWGPSNLALQADDTITSEALQALAATKHVQQGQYPSNWWSQMDIMTGSLLNSPNAAESALQAMLSTYSNSLSALKDAE